VQRARERAAEFMVIVDDDADMPTDNSPFDDEEWCITGPLLIW
jgi:hypothetical protein